MNAVLTDSIVDADQEQHGIVTTWMTCCRDQFEHAVTDEDFAAGQRSGIYRAVCGHLVAAQALISPPGHRCRACACAVTAERRRPARRRSRWTGWSRDEPDSVVRIS